MMVSKVGDCPLSATAPRPRRRERSVAAACGTMQRMAAEIPRPPPPPIDGACALFLDVDGTLLDFTLHPDAVSVPPPLRDILLALHRRLDGAVALVDRKST